MAEILLPDSGAELSGMEVAYEATETPDTLSRKIVYTGPISLVQAKRDELRTIGEQGTGVVIPDGNGEVTDPRGVALRSITYGTQKGRGTLTVNFEDIPAVGNTDALAEDYAEGGTEFLELSGVDVVRDIKTAPYFDALSSADKLAVQQTFDDRLPPDSSFTALMDTLYGHLANGQEGYLQTSYELRRTYTTSSTKEAKVSAANSNTVQALPDIGRLQKLVGTLPAGEWLKKPTTVNYERQAGWRVTEHYQWAPKWSIVYGGTWNP